VLEALDQKEVWEVEVYVHVFLRPAVDGCDRTKKKHTLAAVSLDLEPL